MKRTIKALSAALLATTLLGSTAALAAEVDFGSAGAAADTEYTLEEMLNYAIEDEYMAKAEYAVIMDTYGDMRPFSNIILAEGTHINMLLPLFETYGYGVPADTAAANVVLPATLEETYAIGVEAEIKNIEMYESFLAEELPADVEETFEYLMAASENHLAAFENAVERGTAGGLGQGRSGESARDGQASRTGICTEDGQMLRDGEGVQGGQGLRGQGSRGQGNGIGLNR